MTPRRGVGIEDGFTRSRGRTGQFAERTLDRAWNVTEPYGAFEKEGDRLLVRRVEHRRSCATNPTRLRPELQRRELLRSNLLESKRRELHGVKRGYPGIGCAIRKGQRVQHRELHAGNAKLGQNAPIDEFDERVHDTLRMHHDLDSLVGQTEQEMRLYHLQRLVGERRAV